MKISVVPLLALLACTFLYAAPSTMPYEVQPPSSGEAGHPLAIVLGDAPWTGGDDWFVIRMGKPSEDWLANVIDVQKAVDEVSAAHQVDSSRVLLVSSGQWARGAITLLNRMSDRLIGAVLVDVGPVEYDGSDIRLLQLDGRLANLPIWATVSGLSERAHCLLGWRRVSAAYPSAPLTIDVQQAHSDKLAPDASLADWILSVRGGQTPPARPDAQVVELMDRYGSPAEAIIRSLKVRRLDARGEMPPAEVKSQAGLQLAVLPPPKWQRDPRGEMKYDATANPFVQIYLTPQPGGELFARVQGGKWRATSDELLDDYQQRLAAKGYLVVTHKQLEISHGSAEIVSILWPTEMKWHSWLALMWAGEPSQDIAPMVIVMNAADAPEADPMADAFIHLLQSIRLDHAPAGAPNLSGM